MTETLRTSAIMIANTFFSLALMTILVRFTMSIVWDFWAHRKGKRDALYVWGIVQIPLLYAVGGMAMISCAYAIVNLAVSLLDSRLCQPYMDGQPLAFPVLRNMGGIGGIVAVWCVILSGFFLGLSVGKTGWLLNVSKLFGLLAFLLLLLGLVLACG